MNRPSSAGKKKMGPKFRVNGYVHQFRKYRQNNERETISIAPANWKHSRDLSNFKMLKM